MADKSRTFEVRMERIEFLTKGAGDEARRILRLSQDLRDL